MIILPNRKIIRHYGFRKVHYCNNDKCFIKSKTLDYFLKIKQKWLNFPPTALTKFFGYLEDEVTLHSCLLVNRLWCEISVRIIVWKDVCDYSTWKFRTLIACLPKESKEILHKNKIIIQTQASKPPMFNYASFC